MAGVPIKSPVDVAHAADKIRGRGASIVIVTLGANGAYVCDQDNNVFLQPIPTEVREVSGAGDSLVAGTIAGGILGLPIEDAVRLGQGCASMTLEVVQTVSPHLTLEAATDRAGLTSQQAAHAG